MSNTPEIPRELARGIPRHVCLTSAGKVLLVTAAGLVMVAVASGVGLFLLAARDRERARLIDAEVIYTEAEVVQIVAPRKRSDRRRTLVYQYSAGDRLYTGRTSTRSNEAAKLKAGQRIAVGYLPSRPEQSWIAGREPGGIPILLVPAVPAGLVLAAWLVWRHVRGQRHLLSNGRGAIARVTEVKPRDVLKRQHRVRYEFQLLSGATRSGSYEKQKSRPAPGSTVTIVYDPDNPARQARYPLDLVRLVNAPLERSRVR